MRPIAVDEDGLRIAVGLAGSMDVLFDGARVWSFDVSRDSVTRDGQPIVPWPELLQHYLDGVTELEVRDSATGEAHFRDEIAFGASSRRIMLVDEQGHPVTVNKSGRLDQSFDQADAATRRTFVEAIQRVLTDAREVGGLNAFLAFGCLLGAVRDGKLIGHDTDADLAYLSPYTHPFDVIRESRRAERALRQRGWTIARMSAGDFKVWVELENGQRWGVDIFASFYVDDVYHVVPIRRGPLDRSVIEPLGSITLEGHEFLAPRDVERFLEFYYGPGWRTPDPSYKISHPRDVRRRFGPWLRGSRDQRRYWHEFYRFGGSRQVPEEPSSFAPWVERQIGTNQRVVDVGAGTGRDAVWFAARGHEVVALDFTQAALREVRRRAAANEVQVEARLVNLNILRSVLLEGARLAHASGDAHLYARFLLDSINDNTRQLFWRLATMAQRRGGLTFIEFRTARSRGEPTHFPQHRRSYPRLKRVQDEIASNGGTVVAQEVGRGLAPLGDEDPEVCRLAVRWRS